MGTSDRYAIRRTVAAALAKYCCPLDLNRVLCEDEIMLLNCDPARLRAEWDEMTAAGYLIPVPGYPEYRSLDPALRRKLEERRTLSDDPCFFGPLAVGCAK